MKWAALKARPDVPERTMAARLLDGNAVAARIREELGPRIASFAAQRGRPPGLGIVLAGHDPASEIYVKGKLRAAGEVGCRATLTRVSGDAPLQDVLDTVAGLNADDACDGILVQSPLPSSMGAGAEQTVFDTIDPDKDVDGFTAVNAGRLVQNRAVLAPGTPSGVIELLRRSGIDLIGARAVVIGRSDIVGKPMAMLLLHQHATVTICHSRTRDLPSIVREADIVVAAIGRAAFVLPAWIKPGATVVDVGINRVTDAAEVERLYPAGSRRRETFAAKRAIVVGDVHPGVAEIAGALTPVPGGVGPLTIAMLLRNTVTAAEHRAATGHPA
jgi:methylenetetrahydrofolate dehydrogenase (NADP+)/methenyltetrahydrofolate cyclohydrolase